MDFKIVKVDAECSELNQAAEDGFLFVDWVPSSTPQTWPNALVARPSDTALDRLLTDENADKLVRFLKDVEAQMRGERSDTEPAPPSLDETPDDAPADPPAPAPASPDPSPPEATP